MTSYRTKKNAPRPQVLLIHRALIINQDKFLLLKRHKKDRYMPSCWELPGGKLEQDEIPETTLKAEVLEETGLQIKIIKPIAHVDGRLIDNGPYKGLAYVGLTSICQIEKDTDFKISEEHEDYAWVNLDKIVNYNLTPESQKAIEELSDLT